MAGNQLCHLEHADLLLAVEDGFQGLVGIDEGLLFGVLQLVLFDVGPELFGQLCAREGLVADNFGKLRVRGNWLHESRVGCSLCLFRFSSHAPVFMILLREERNTKISLSSLG